jgi:hypothetical protein
MATLDWEQTRRDGVTLVELSVTADTAEPIRIESELQPVWPPRRQGVPATGWDDGGFEGQVDPASPLVLGYASPATPADPPATVHTRDADNRRGAQTDTSEQTADGVVRALGQNTPPRDVVPTPEPVQATPTPEPTQDTTSSGAAQTDSTIERRETSTDTTAQPRQHSETEPDPERLEPWFEAIEDRLDEAEQLAGVSGADEARGAIDALGGLGAVRALAADIEQDRAQLERLESRQRRLRERLAAVDIPLATLERVA